MLEVWKFPLAPEDHPVVMMPASAKVLSVGEQKGGAFVWALVDPNVPFVRHAFRLAGTGHQIVTVEAEKYIGTFQMLNGALVWHVFDLGEQPQ